ncbi:MAG: serine hydrolase [Nitrospirae bacterium]|nr:serine hydrolase [Nitrospirota bacterium]
MKKFSYRYLCMYLTAATLLFIGGWFGHSLYEQQRDRAKSRRARLVGYFFTSPLLDVELPEGIVIGREPIPFKHKINAFVQKQLDTKQVSKLGVYYRDLHDGPWFGINAKEALYPASMMKVPIMIAWLKRAEHNPRELKHTYTYDGANDRTAVQLIKPENKLIPGRSYTVDELLVQMMTYSDNNAAFILHSKLETSELNAVIDGMDINNEPDIPDNLLSLHAYSGFFRILYNAAFLNREMSEKALGLLSLQDFPQGIVGGVPKGTPVASKFGEHVEGRNEEEKHLHEFGIVYHPKYPYILGIMTRGHDFNKQAEIIREISRMIYAAVDADISIEKNTMQGTP